MSTININGVKIQGDNISIRNGVITVDGKNVTPGNDKVINIAVEGNVGSLRVDACDTVKVSGNAGVLESGSGKVEVGGLVQGNVSAGSGDIKCGDVGGNVSTGSGDVECGKVSGSLRTGSGDITHA